MPAATVPVFMYPLLCRSLQCLIANLCMGLRFQSDAVGRRLFWGHSIEKKFLLFAANVSDIVLIVLPSHSSILQKVGLLNEWTWRAHPLFTIRHLERAVNAH